jgi:predicted RNase H-like HicB family nuclease
MSTLTGIYFKSDGWYIGVCLEVPGAWTQGRTLRSCKRNLVEASALLIECEAEENVPDLPPDFIVDGFELDEKKIIAEYIVKKGVRGSARRRRTHDCVEPVKQGNTTRAKALRNKRKPRTSNYSKIADN